MRAIVLVSVFQLGVAPILSAATVNSAPVQQFVPILGHSRASADPTGSTQVTPGRQRLSSSEVAKRSSPAIVTIRTEAGQGSGVIVDPAGVIVTNLHVVRGQSKASVRLANGDVYDDVSVVDVDERKDLLVLKIKGFGLPTAPIGNSDQAAVGDRVVLIGSPRGLENTVSDGLISAIRDSGDGYRLLQTSAAASPGSSGGGIFNDFGELIGILSAKLTNGENINFGLPVNYVRGLLSTQAQMTLAQLATRFPEVSDRATSPTSTPASQAAADAAAFAKLQALMKAVTFKVEKASDTSWVATFSGDHAKSVRVYIEANSDLALITSIVSKNPTLSVDQLTTIMKRNVTMDLVRAGITKDGSLMVLGEAELRLLDSAGLETLVDAVAVYVDEAVGYLTGSSKVAGRSALVGPPSGSARTLSILQGHATIQYASSSWKPQNANENGHYEFEHVSKAAYVKVITERIEVPLDKMPDIALANARKADPTVKETARGWRMVNGKRMLFLEFQSTLNNLQFTGYGHYYSDASGTVQILAWTSQTVIDAYRDDIEAFVSGFRLRDK